MVKGLRGWLGAGCLAAALGLLVSAGQGEEKGGPAESGPAPDPTAPLLPLSPNPSPRPGGGYERLNPAPAGDAGGAVTFRVPEEERRGEEPRPPSGAAETPGETAAVSPLLAAAIAREEKLRKEEDPGKWVQVVAAYRAVTDAEPNNAAARHRLGLALARAGETRAAAAELERVLILCPHEPRYLLDFATLAAETGQYQKALEACQEALRAKPDAPRAHNSLGNVYFAIGDNARAAASYAAAARLEPRNPRYLHNLGRAYLSGGRSKEAVDIFTEVIRLDAASAEAHNDRAAAYRALKETRRAIEDLRAALRLRPDYALAHYNLARIFANDQDVEFVQRFEALEQAQAAVKLSDGKDPRFLLGLADAYRINHEFDKAVEAARQATLLDPRKEYLDELARYEQIKKDGFGGALRP